MDRSGQEWKQEEGSEKMSHDEIMNDLQQPKKEDSELEKVVQRIRCCT